MAGFFVNSHCFQMSPFHKSLLLKRLFSIKVLDARCYLPGGRLFAPLLLLPTLWLLASCGGDSDRRLPDVSNISVNIKLQRFEQDLFQLDTSDLPAGMQQLTGKYPALLPLFALNIIHDQTNPAETPLQSVGNFLRAPEVRHLNDTVQQLYGNLDWLERDLSQMFRYYQYYLPDKPIPQVATIVSEFGTDAFTAGDSLCGIGLDMYLGENFPGYNPEIFPDYIRRQFRREYIPVRLAKALARNAVEAPSGQRLLDLMLYHGKQLYLVDCLLPLVADSAKMGYTRAQLEGSEGNEQQVWARLLTQNLLYSTDFGKFKKLVTPSPNAPVVFQEAPGEVGNWLGWQIVKSYMKRHPETTMAQLLHLSDAQKFLEEAKYKPRRPL